MRLRSVEYASIPHAQSAHAPGCISQYHTSSPRHYHQLKRNRNQLLQHAGSNVQRESYGSPDPTWVLHQRFWFRWCRTSSRYYIFAPRDVSMNPLLKICRLVRYSKKIPVLTIILPHQYAWDSGTEWVCPVLPKPLHAFHLIKERIRNRDASTNITWNQPDAVHLTKFWHHFNHSSLDWTK